MRTDTVVGFVPTDAGIMLCADCASDDIASEDEARGSVVFGSSETDAPCHCDECGALISETLTPDGVSYVADAFREYVTAVLFKHEGDNAVLPRQTGRHAGSASTLDTWRDAFADSLRYSTYKRVTDALALFDTVRAWQAEALEVVLVTCEGFARKYGNDDYGAAWTESDAPDDGSASDCAVCGAAVYSGWQCLDGGEVVCSSHVFTPEDARRVASEWHDGSSVYGASLAKVASSGTVDELATEAAQHFARGVSTLLAHDGTRRASSYNYLERRKIRHELEALRRYCHGVRTREYPAALLDIRELANKSDMPAHARIARIQLRLDAAGLPTPDGTGIGAPWH